MPLYRKCQLINRKNERMGEGSVLPLEKVIIDQGSPSDAATPGGRSRGTGDSPARGICLRSLVGFQGKKVPDGGQNWGSCFSPVLRLGIGDRPHAAPPDVMGCTSSLCSVLEEKT